MAKGIVRKIDELGRITLPMEYRKSFGIGVKSPIGMYIVGGVIHLVKVDDRFRGIAREMDELGRLTLPIECRRTLGLGDRQEVDIYVDGDEICVQKVEKECVICGSTTHLIEVNGKKICTICVYAAIDMLGE
jgi:transcriptional pleiotropic regulator of transition state genes